MVKYDYNLIDDVSSRYFSKLVEPDSYFSVNEHGDLLYHQDTCHMGSLVNSPEFDIMKTNCTAYKREYTDKYIHGSDYYLITDRSNIFAGISIEGDLDDIEYIEVKVGGNVIQTITKDFDKIKLLDGLGIPTIMIQYHDIQVKIKCKRRDSVHKVICTHIYLSYQDRVFLAQIKSFTKTLSNGKTITFERGMLGVK